ncbi:MAG: zinc-dependent alcohol dehydrogenase family protein [SAR324 cluster bacterium]|nr:zinc-dependent alcohol dehydrogenase family protein [SAR324 cluster bacterium]
MKVVVFKEKGSLDVLKIEDHALPDPAGTDVRVKITSIGLNRADSLFRQGLYFFQPAFPSRVGYEGAGIVDAVGSKVTFLKPGDRVAILPSSFNASHQGCCAEYGIYPESHLLPTPSSIDDEIAGGIWMQYITAWDALIEDARIQKGDCVVIPAASSSVGVAAIQIVNMHGGVSIATTTSPAKMEALSRLGAQHVINIKDGNYVERVKAISQGKGARIIFDPVAGPTVKDHIAAAATHGIIFIYGLLDRRPMDIHAGVLMKKQLTLKGYTLMPLFQDLEKLRKVVQSIATGLEQGLLVPIIAKKFKLESFRDAFEYLESNEQIGKIIINP